MRLSPKESKPAGDTSIGRMVSAPVQMPAAAVAGLVRARAVGSPGPDGGAGRRLLPDGGADIFLPGASLHRTGDAVMLPGRGARLGRLISE